MNSGSLSTWKDALLDLGMAAEESAAPFVPQGEFRMSIDQFRTDAERALRVLEHPLLDYFIPRLEQAPGRWHPSGYAVFPLGRHSELGRLRLHIWPAGLRRQEQRPPGERDIHDHVMHIASLVVAGVYRDRFYQVTPVELELEAEDCPPAGIFRVFAAIDHQPAARGIGPTGLTVRAIPGPVRRVQTGESHFIPCGPFHQPMIPPEALAVTLLFSSPPLKDQGPYVLVAGPAAPIAGRERRVSRMDAARLTSDVLRSRNRV